MIEAGVASVGREPVAAIGPGAGPCCYEVGEDVAGPLTRRFGEDVVRDGRADLWLCAERALRTSGVRAGGSCGRVHDLHRGSLLLAPPRPTASPAARGWWGCLLDPDLIAENLALVRERVGPDVQILAATKYVEADDLPALHEGGVRLVGENRSDALIVKQEAHHDLFTWDFIGHVQSRKVREVVGRVRLIHAIDSLSACRRMQDQADDPVDCLLQVNVAGEDTQGGRGARRMSTDSSTKWPRSTVSGSAA